MASPARGVAQPGRAPRSGRGGREFKSRHPDHPVPPLRDGMVEQESSRQEKVENGERLLAGVQVLAVRTSLSCGLLSTYYSLPFAVGATAALALEQYLKSGSGHAFANRHFW